MKNRIVKISMATWFLLFGAGRVGAQQMLGGGGRVESAWSPQALHAVNQVLRDTNGASQQPEIDATGPEGLRLTLQADGNLYSLNQQVNLRVKLTNVSRGALAIWRESGLTYKLVVQRPDGSVAPLTPRGKQGDWIAHTFSGGGSNLLTPGSQSEQSLRAVNYDFDMTQIGEYSLQVSREVPSVADPEQPVRIYSNVVNVTVLSPSQQKQREASERQDNAARLRRWIGKDKQLLPPKDFLLSIAADRRSYTPGDRIAFDATLENRGADLNFTYAPQYKIELMQADGALLPLTPQGEDAQGLVEPLFGATGARILRGGGSETQHMDTARLYDIQKPGDYWLRVSREVSRRDANANDVSEDTKTLYSNVIKFTIEAPKAEETKPAK